MNFSGIYFPLCVYCFSYILQICYVAFSFHSVKTFCNFHFNFVFDPWVIYRLFMRQNVKAIGEGIELQKKKKEIFFTESFFSSKHGAKCFYNIDSITAKTLFLRYGKLLVKKFINELRLHKKCKILNWTPCLPISKTHTILSRSHIWGER